MPNVDLTKIIRDIPSLPYQAEYQPVLDASSQPIEPPIGCLIPPLDPRPIEFGPATPPVIDKGCLQPFFPFPIIPVPFVNIPEITVPCPDGFTFGGTTSITINGVTVIHDAISKVTDCEWNLNTDFNFDIPILCPDGITINDGAIVVTVKDQDGNSLGSDSSGAITAKATPNTDGQNCTWDLAGAVDIVINLPDLNCPTIGGGTDSDNGVSVTISAMKNPGLCDWSINPTVSVNLPELAQAVKDELQDDLDDRYCQCGTTASTTTARNCCDIPGSLYPIQVTVLDVDCPGAEEGVYCCDSTGGPFDRSGSLCAEFVAEHCSPFCLYPNTFDGGSCTCGTVTEKCQCNAPVADSYLVLWCHSEVGRCTPEDTWYYYCCEVPESDPAFNIANCWEMCLRENYNANTCECVDPTTSTTTNTTCAGNLFIPLDSEACQLAPRPLLCCPLGTVAYNYYNSELEDCDYCYVPTDFCSSGSNYCGGWETINDAGTAVQIWKQTCCDPLSDIPNCVPGTVPDNRNPADLNTPGPNVGWKEITCCGAGESLYATYIDNGSGPGLVWKCCDAPLVLSSSYTFDWWPDCCASKESCT